MNGSLSKDSFRHACSPTIPLMSFIAFCVISWAICCFCTNVIGRFWILVLHLMGLSHLTNIVVAISFLSRICWNSCCLPLLKRLWPGLDRNLSIGFSVFGLEPIQSGWFWNSINGMAGGLSNLRGCGCGCGDTTCTESSHCVCEATCGWDVPFANPVLLPLLPGPLQCPRMHLG